ncbi:S8 family serine peptidase [Streptomyces cyaneus]|uniref:S8 family serine peptidase n=1 Tax=Streptomyces cyaneus TaxID=1904 RepID=UPI000FF89F9D|nr:S8 family serine peptidase [Streptomyces cyaneus]
MIELSPQAAAKIDTRLAHLLALSEDELNDLVRNEREALRTWLVRHRRPPGLHRSGHGGRGNEQPDAEPVSDSSGDVAGTRGEEERVPAPPVALATGLHLPPSPPAGEFPMQLDRAYVSVFIESQASLRDLERLGAVLRNQLCDLVTAYIPLELVPRLAESPAVTAIELSRPVFLSLDGALAYSQVDQVQAGPPPHTGAGVVVGVVDDELDVYHPDLRGPAPVAGTRVRHLWDQNLVAVAGENRPPTGAALPGVIPLGGASYGVDYSAHDINAELNRPAGTAAYSVVRHGGIVAGHGTHVTGIAAGNGLGSGAPAVLRGAAPEADLVFVALRLPEPEVPASDAASVLDACMYITARAQQRRQPCVINLSLGDGQGPHDGSLLGERFLDLLVSGPGRAVVIGSGNATGAQAHATGTVPAGASTDLVLSYAAVPGGHMSDVIELWYDGHDRFDVTLTAPNGAVIGPVGPGSSVPVAGVGFGISGQLRSVLHAGTNGDNTISVVLNVAVGASLAGAWTLTLTGNTVINGRFHSWVDVYNSGSSAWQPPHVDDATLTLTQLSTARRAITVGNHTKAGPPAVINAASGRGPTRDGRTKPELATVGTNVSAPRSRDMTSAAPGPLYTAMSGTSMAAPLVSGACALVLECRGPQLTGADLKQILTDSAGTLFAPPYAVPHPGFGFGFLQAATACTAQAGPVDVWIRDAVGDTGVEPFVGPVMWECPDIEILDIQGNATPNPRHHPANRFNNRIRVTVRNRGTQTARNTEVSLYWADPATNIPYPLAWNRSGIFTGTPAVPPAPPLSGFTTQGNQIIVPRLSPGSATRVEFAWAPPPPGSSLRADNHFCLLVLLENLSDPSGIGSSGFPEVGARNNVGLRNVHVLPNATGGDAVSGFYVVGTDGEDGISVSAELAAGEVTLSLPVQALPWRDLAMIEELGKPRAPYGHPDPWPDPLADRDATLDGSQLIEELTGITAAQRLEVRDGIASIDLTPRTPLGVPCLHLAPGARLPTTIGIVRLDTTTRRRHVRVTQWSNGRRIGGVTVELRKGMHEEKR